MVKYICFAKMAKEFLRLPLDERDKFLPKWTETAKEFGIRVLFRGVPMGVTEDIVIVFETKHNSETWFKFMRVWLKLGTPEAGKIIEYTRTITIH